MSDQLQPDEQREANEFLDELRESGVTNMYGAGPYVMEEFGWDHHKARAAVSEWMRTFAFRHPRSETYS